MNTWTEKAGRVSSIHVDKPKKWKETGDQTQRGDIGVLFSYFFLKFIPGRRKR